MILGVDISTSITGFAIVADDEIVFYDSIDLRKYKDIFEKTNAIKEKILDLYEMYRTVSSHVHERQVVSKDIVHLNAF